MCATVATSVHQSLQEGCLLPLASALFWPDWSALWRCGSGNHPGAGGQVSSSRTLALRRTCNGGQQSPSPVQQVRSSAGQDCVRLHPLAGSKSLNHPETGLWRSLWAMRKAPPAAQPSAQSCRSYLCNASMAVGGHAAGRRVSSSADVRCRAVQVRRPPRSQARPPRPRRPGCRTCCRP